MLKDLIVSSSSHETRAAILEDDQLAEVYFERPQERTIAGGIYKGRVKRVLPGMQSAFVDIGLERDAFLYVSDFLEDTEEYDKIVTGVEEKVARLDQEAAPARAAIPGPEAAAPVAEGVPAAGSGAPRADAAGPATESPGLPLRDRGRRRRSRRRRFRDRGFPESKYASGTEVAAPPKRGGEDIPLVLPGESLAKYRHLTQAQPAPGAHAEGEEAPARQESHPAFGAAPPEEAPEHEAPPSSEMMTEATWNAEGEPDPQPEELTGPAAAAVAGGALEGADIEAVAVAERVAGEQQADAGRDDRSQQAPVEVPAAEAPAPAAGTPAEQAQVRGSSQQARFPRRLSRRMRRKLRQAQAQPACQGAPAAERPEHVERRGQPLITDLLREGQEIIVQIAKEPLGKKGARITSHIALPGRYVVYMPTVDHVGVSRKIGSEEERQRLKRIVLERRKQVPGGVIVRTAGEGRSEEDIRQDIDFLHQLWLDIRAKAEGKPAPALLHHDLNLVERILRDQLSESFHSVWVDNEQEYEKILDFVQQFQPELVSRVKLYTKDTPIFEQFNVQEEINKALKPKVWLKSGGYIVINQTEALVAIDVNTGKFVGKTQRLEDTIVKTNVDAIREIVRQIRLRDLGGIIVIDFIDMDERKNRQKVMQTLEEALRADRAPSKILAFNDFGLVAITRKRVKHSLERTLCVPCPDCDGSGFVKSPHSVAMGILAAAHRHEPAPQRKEVILRVNPEVARYLKQKDVTVLQDIEELTHRPVLIKSDPNLHIESFDFN